MGIDSPGPNEYLSGDLVNISGGMTAWQNAGYPVDKENQ